MTLPRFEHSKPRTISEAVELATEGENVRYLAGGTDLLPQMRAGTRSVQTLVDIKHIDELSQFGETEEGGLSIGAGCVLTDIAGHPRVRKDYPLLAQCCLSVGSYPLRNRATMAGNICNASPAADTAAALLCLDAAVTVTGGMGSRSVPVAEFFKGPGQTVLDRGELVTAVTLPRASAGRNGRYLRLSRRRGVDLATVGVLVTGGARGDGGNGGGAAHRVSLVAVAPRPIRVTESEAVLDQEGPTEGAARKAAEAAQAAASPISDVRGSAEYRSEMVFVLVRRGVGLLAAHKNEPSA